MAAMTIYGKNQKFSTPEPESFEVESWQIASGIQGLPKLFIGWPF